MGIVVGIIVFYGWFLNIVYFFDAKTKHTGNTVLYILGFFIFTLGAVYGYYNLFNNTRDYNKIK